MRRLFTTAEANDRGLSRAALRWGERTGRWRRIDINVYAEGPEPPSALDAARAAALATGGIAGGCVAGVLLALDAVELRGPDVSVPLGRNGRPGFRRRTVSPEHVVRIEGIACTDGPQTLIDLAAALDDLRWEQALESGLRKRLLSIDDLVSWPARVRGMSRVRRVLALRRPAGAPPTESLLETLMVQLARTVPGLGPPVRQLEVFDEHGQFVARVDLAWPELGLFIELDGQQHLGQPVYDARRETAVVAATGWLCGRFTWTEVVTLPNSTARRLAALADRARQRPVA